MIQIFSFVNFLIFIPVSLLTLLILRIIVLPYLRISSYKREGRTTYFFPIIGALKYTKDGGKKYDDVMANSKGKNEKTRNSKIIVTHIGKDLLLVLRDPQYIKEVLQKPSNYCKGSVFKVFRYLLGNGLVSAEGETWKRHRKIISNSFHFEFLKTNMSVIQNTAKEFLDKITPDQYNNFPVISKVQEITGEIVGRIFFGEKLNDYTYEGKQLTLALADVISDLGLCARTPLVLLLGPKALELSFVPKHRRVMKRIQGFRQVCFDIIKDRKSNSQQGNDLLSSLLATQKLDDPELRFSDEDVIDEFITFFVAGMDTTGHLIGMTLYNLTQYPEYLKEIKEEREKTYNQEEQINVETLHKMDLLHALLKETLRLYTPAPILAGREVLVDHTLVDFKLKKGDFVVGELLAAPFDPKIIEKPEDFNPSRWMDPNFKIDPFAFVPFSAGPRNCIGQHLAIIESKVILSEFLERFDFKLIDGYKLKMIQRFLYEPEQDVGLNLSLKK